MRIAIIECYPIKTANIKNMIDAHLRNSILLANELRADCLIVEQDFIEALNKQYDVFILGYASRYAPFNTIKKLLERNPNAVKYMLSNEYTLGSASVGGYKPFSLISNWDWKSAYPKGAKNILGNHQLNLNYLFAREPNPLTAKKYDCVYYGTFRPDRKKYFQEYLQGNIKVSTTSKNYKKFDHIGCKPQFIGKLTWEKGKETLNNFRYQLYIEDVFTHKYFNNMANRWYEAGYCNNVVFFDNNCWNTINKSEIAPYAEQIKEYVVKNKKELDEKIKLCNQDFEKHLAIQKSWRMSELQQRREMLEEFKDIIFNKRLGS